MEKPNTDLASTPSNAGTTETGTSPATKKLGVVALTALIVGGVLASGIFSLPQNMAEGAGAGAILIAWVITFFGMLTLTKIFVWLSLERQDIDDGVYGYARHGFGNYLGFNAAWGYWISVWISNAGYLVIFFGTLGSFGVLPFLGDGTTLGAFVCQVGVLWMLHFFVLKGVRSAALVNVVITVAKVVPLLLFVVCVALTFRVDVFKIDFWGTPELGSVMTQVKSTMLFTVWVFLGIECATIYATRAKDALSVSRATIYGFIITVILLACVSILSLGVVAQSELAVMPNPSMAGVLEAAVGPWGSILIRVGFMVSLSGALLTWTLLSSEMLYLSGRGKEHTSPKIFGKVNKAGTPAPALWLTNILVTLLLLYNFYNASGYNKLIQLATSMALIPYWLCAGFAVKQMIYFPEKRRTSVLMFAVLGTIYSTWLIYAAGMKFLLLSMILYAPGILFFIVACREKNTPAFPSVFSKLFAVMVVVLGLIALYLLLTGDLKL